MLAGMSVLDRTLRDVVFRLSSRHVPGARRVVLVGSFNRWDSAVHRLVLSPDGWWSISVTLAPGEYRYFFLVDGIPWNDPEDHGRAACEWGGQYSVRVVA
jgi:1,4-alpha-glucan branching enzyme